jgi:hypothetical protein
MSIFIARRLIVFAGSTADPRTPTDPQVALVQGLVGISLDPQRFQLEYPLLPPNSDFYDVLVDQAFDKSPYVVLFESEMYDTGEIVKRDLLGKGDYPLTWSGWEIPGDEHPSPPDAPLPPTVVMTAAERRALALVRKYRAPKA